MCLVTPSVIATKLLQKHFVYNLSPQQLKTCKQENYLRAKLHSCLYLKHFLKFSRLNDLTYQWKNRICKQAIEILIVHNHGSLQNSVGALSGGLTLYLK